MLRLIRDLLRPYRWLLAIIVAMSLVEAAMGLAAPWPLKIVVDSVVGNQPVPLWATWFGPMLAHGGKMQIAALAAIIVVATWGANALATYVGFYLIESVGQRVANDLRLRAYRHLNRLSLRYFLTQPIGNIVSTITTDVRMIQDFASRGTIFIFVDTLMIVGMAIVMFIIRWDFALIAIALLPFLAIVVRRVGGVIAKKITELRNIEADMMAFTKESLESMEVVAAFQLEEMQEIELARVGRLSVMAALKARRAGGLLGPVVVFPIALCYGFFLWRGSSLILSGAMTLGSLTVFTVYLTKFFDPVQDLSTQADTFAQASVAARRLQAILEVDDIVPEHPDAIDPPPFRGEIGFEHVAFEFEAGHPVLRDVNFTIKPGELVGMVGVTGGGKSTVTGLIPRFADPTAGTITIDGCDIRRFTLSGLRSQIANVMQDAVLCRGTVRANIALGRPNASEDEIIEAAKLANAHDFITRMPQGYDSMVGERGLTLSGGQRQRIGIARALIRDAPILILDEPTAALDAESEQLVIEAMWRLMKGRTVICVAHRLSTIRSADTIIVIADGVVAEQGSHEELMAFNGVYAELYRIQFKEPKAIDA